MKSQSLVFVKWKDHAQFSDTRWRGREEVKEILGKPCLIWSVGWIIHETKELIILAAVLDDEGCSRSEITIFKSCIVQKRKLK